MQSAKLSVFAAAAHAPTRTALVVDGRAISFADLAIRVRSILPALQRSLHGVPRAALVGETDLPTLELLYGLIGLGRPVVLLHPRASERERRGLLEAAAPATLLDPSRIERDLMATLPPPMPVPDDDRPLVVLPTSGTSGEPKGVVLSRRAFVASAEASAANLGWEEDDRWLLSLPIAHVGGLSILTRALVARGTVVVHRAPRFEPREVTRLIDAERITLLSLVPTTLRRLLELDPPWDPPPSVRAILVGGAPVPPSLRAAALERGWPVLTTYGLTEACSQVATQPYAALRYGEPPQPGAPPLPGVEVRIRDGIVEVRGPQLLSGYLPERAETFTADGWFVTGDLGRLDENGWLHVEGRRDDVIVSGGEKVLATEVEAALEEHPAVAAACVFGVEDAEWGRAVAAALAAAGEPPGDAALLDFLDERLARYKLPRLVTWLDELPRLPSGKLDRGATVARARRSLRALSRFTTTTPAPPAVDCG